MRHSFCPQDGQSRPATITDACPDVHLHRMLKLGFIAWLTSSLVAACAPVSFNLHSCLIRKDNILKGSVLILFAPLQSLLIYFPNYLAVFVPLAVHPKSFLHRSMDDTNASNPSTSFFSSFCSSSPVVLSFFFIWSTMIS